MVHVYSGKLDIKSVLVKWVNLDLVIQNEVGQKEKNKYHVLTYIWNIEKWY